MRLVLPALALAVTLLLGHAWVRQSGRRRRSASHRHRGAYLAATKPFRDRLGRYQEQLVAHQQAAADGQLDSIAIIDLGDLTRELFAARQAFTEPHCASVRAMIGPDPTRSGWSRARRPACCCSGPRCRRRAQPDSTDLIREVVDQGRSSSRLFGEAAA